jgi:hypothetical protein
MGMLTNNRFHKPKTEQMSQVFGQKLKIRNPKQYQNSNVQNTKEPKAKAQGAIRVV